MPELGFWSIAQDDPEKLALVDPDEREVRAGELLASSNQVVHGLRAAGLEPVRNLVGSYITSLEMAGASLTVLELDDELIALWDAPVHTAALRWGV